MNKKLRGNEYRTTVLCIDSYEENVPTGRFYNPYLKQGEPFNSLTQLLLKVEQNLDTMQLPQAFTTTRSFAPAPTPKTEQSLQSDTQVGKVATFALRIIFRQNASWQGSITWLEEGREQSFRSVLELIFLMDSALSDSQ